MPFHSENNKTTNLGRSTMQCVFIKKLKHCYKGDIFLQTITVGCKASSLDNATSLETWGRLHRKSTWKETAT